jgi:hypothetical protein
MYEEIFVECEKAIRNGKQITRKSRKDKEFHFQNWFQDRLESLNIDYTPNGRNTYPDFLIDKEKEGYEIKGLTHPGRSNDFDANSQVPMAKHNGREIFYVFGRYPRTPDSSYPVHDLVLCHGSFLNNDKNYKHKNKSTRGFGSYGDILIRDRKMYVPPAPFGLLDGVEGNITLIIPKSFSIDLEKFETVGEFSRQEVEKKLKSYSFDLETNELKRNLKKNSNAGKIHKYSAYRIKGSNETEVKLK